MTYRDEADAARRKRDALRRELADIDGAIEAGGRAHERRRALRGSLEQAERDVDRARAKVALPLLAQVRVASPCHARWEDMRGDERARHCASCDKTVFDLSAMTSDEAEALLRAHGASMCARFHRRADGTVMTSDCSVGVARARRRGWALAAGLTATAGLTVLGAGAAVAAYLVVGGEAETEHYVMGTVAPDPYVMGGVSPEPLMGEVALDPTPEPRASNGQHDVPHVQPPHAQRPHVEDGE